jgi:hypothetical protein
MLLRSVFILFKIIKTIKAMKLPLEIYKTKLVLEGNCKCTKSILARTLFCLTYQIEWAQWRVCMQARCSRLLPGCPWIASFSHVYLWLKIIIKLTAKKKCQVYFTVLLQIGKIGWSYWK